MNFHFHFLPSFLTTSISFLSLDVTKRTQQTNSNLRKHIRSQIAAFSNLQEEKLSDDDFSGRIWKKKGTNKTKNGNMSLENQIAKPGYVCDES